jgi:hypothetical protein
MSKIRAWFWWFALDSVTSNYIRYKQPNENLLTRYLTREQTLCIPWERLDEIELPGILFPRDRDECRAWYERLDYREMNYYVSRLDDKYMYKLYLLRKQERQEAHEAWLRVHIPRVYKSIIDLREKKLQKGSTGNSINN